MRDRRSRSSGAGMDIVAQASTTPFLVKLWAMLADEGNKHAIAWDTTGDAFEVLSPEMMSKHVIPQHFRHNNFSSFQRQLNYFGFKKIGKGAYGCLYQHENFRRDFPALVLQIRRKTNSEHKLTSTGIRQMAVKRSQTAKRSASKQESRGGRRSTRKRRTASATDMNPYAKNSYSYSPSNWTSQGDLMRAEQQEDGEDEGAESDFTSSGTRRSKRMRGRVNSLGNDEHTDSSDDRGRSGEDSIEEEPTHSRRRQRVRSGSTHYAVTDITNQTRAPENHHNAQMQMQMQMQMQPGFGNMASMGDQGGRLSAYSPTLGLLGLDASEEENLMGYNIYSPAPNHMHMPSPAPIIPQIHAQHAPKTMPQGVCRSASASALSLSAASALAAPTATNVAADVKRESSAEKCLQPSAMDGMVAGPVPVQPVQPSSILLTQQQSARISATITSKSSIDATAAPAAVTVAAAVVASLTASAGSNSGVGGVFQNNSNNAGTCTVAVDAPSVVIQDRTQMQTQKMLLHHHVQANSTVSITVPVPVSIPRSRSNSVDCPQGPKSNLAQNSNTFASAPAAIAAAAGSSGKGSAAVAAAAKAAGVVLGVAAPLAAGAPASVPAPASAATLTTATAAAEPQVRPPPARGRGRGRGAGAPTDTTTTTAVQQQRQEHHRQCSSMLQMVHQHQPQSQPKQQQQQQQKLVSKVPVTSTGAALPRPKSQMSGTITPPFGIVGRQPLMAITSSSAPPSSTSTSTSTSISASASASATTTVSASSVLSKKEGQARAEFSRQHMSMMRYYNHDPCLPPVSPFMFSTGALRLTPATVPTMPF